MNRIKPTLHEQEKADCQKSARTSPHLHGELEIEGERGVAGCEVHTDPNGEAETPDGDREDWGDGAAQHVRRCACAIVGRSELVEDAPSQDEVRKVSPFSI